jgi:hypothetical protein
MARAVCTSPETQPEPAPPEAAGGLPDPRRTFTNLAEHTLSTPPQNVFLDTTATNANQFSYRIKVERPNAGWANGDCGSLLLS